MALPSHCFFATSKVASPSLQVFFLLSGLPTPFLRFASETYTLEDTGKHINASLHAYVHTYAYMYVSVCTARLRSLRPPAMDQ